MSECKIRRDFCLTHKCWVAVWDDPRCPVSELSAEVERLTVANKVLQYGLRQSCGDSLEHRRRIEAALQRLQWAGCKARGCSNPSCAAVHEVTHILRGTP